MKKFLAIAIVGLALSGCMQTPTVNTNVQAYSAMPASVATKSVFVTSFKGQNRSSLQYRANEQILITALTEKGMVVTTNRSRADYIAYTGFGIDAGERVTTQYSIPQFGVTGYSGANTYGTVYGNTYSATTTLTPTYGITGYQTGTSSSVVFTRSFALDLVNRRTGKKEFEAISISRGSCNSFTPVAKEIIGATLSNFPQGKVGSVSLEWAGSC